MEKILFQDENLVITDMYISISDNKYFLKNILSYNLEKGSIAKEKIIEGAPGLEKLGAILLCFGTFPMTFAFTAREETGLAVIFGIIGLFMIVISIILINKGNAKKEYSYVDSFILRIRIAEKIITIENENIIYIKNIETILLEAIRNL